MRIFGFALTVFVAVLLTYLPSVRYEFVAYDDQEYVVCNTNVLSGASFDNIVWAVKSCGYADNWHPLTWISLQLDASALGIDLNAHCDNPEGVLRSLSSVMHAHNVVLHAANAALLFLLVVLMAKRVDSDTDVVLPLSALFALLWAIHPLRTEVVCWVSERKELLSVFWMLLTLYIWINGRSAACSVLALLCFAFALLAKPVAVTLPVVLFVWDWVMTEGRFVRSLVRVAPFLLLAAGASIMTLAAQVGAIDVGSGYTVVEKIVMSFSAPVIYLRQTLLPIGLSAFYPLKPSVPWVELGLGIVLFFGAAVACILWLFHRTSRLLALLSFAVAWCLVSLVPMLGVVKVGNQTHSDRYTYWVGCGLAAVLTLAASRYAKRYGRVLMKVLLGVLAVMAVATWMRMPVWRDSIALFSDAVPKSWWERPVCALVWRLRQQGDEGERKAEAILREAVTRTHALSVTAEFAHLLACRAQPSTFTLDDSDPAFAEARMEAQSVLSVDPAHPLANEALAVVEMKEGQWSRAISRLELARTKCARDVAGRIDREIAICRERMAATGR